MPTFHDELKRRTEQFVHYLKLMQRRQKKITESNSYIIFEERLDTDNPGCEQLTESKALVYHAALDVAGWNISGDEAVVTDLPDEGWRGDDSSSRFIQFSFNPRYFDIDIPNVTLWRAEAEIILRRRSGFFYVTENRQFEHPEEEADRYNPLRKVYVYGDQRAAAEDMAYVFFNVWKFPVDWRFYVTAAAFYKKTKWEKGFPID